MGSEFPEIRGIRKFSEGSKEHDTDFLALSPRQRRAFDWTGSVNH